MKEKTKRMCSALLDNIGNLFEYMEKLEREVEELEHRLDVLNEKVKK